MRADTTIRTVEMHTAGEPVRVIVDGYPIPEGPTLLDRRRDARERRGREGLAGQREAERIAGTKEGTDRGEGVVVEVEDAHLT